MQRSLVIGDIHGGLRALKQVLERAAVTLEDRLIFLGDYVDGWSEGSAVVSFLTTLSETHNCTFLRGNHDDLCHRWLQDREENLLWLQHGGAITRAGYQNLPDSEIQQHLRFFENMRDYVTDAQNRLFVHAGFQNHHGPQYEYHSTAFYWDRTLWETALALDVKLPVEDARYPQRLRLFSEIYIGHTPVTRIGKNRPYRAANVWNIDTGAAFKGVLSVMDIDSKEVWQSDPVWTLYPQERGRN